MQKVSNLIIIPSAREQKGEKSKRKTAEYQLRRRILERSNVGTKEKDLPSEA